MKKLLLSMAAVAMLASCSSDEMVEQAQEQRVAIDFKSFVDKSTRAEINKDNIEAFQVWGLMQKESGTVGTPFVEVDVTRTKTGDTWGAWGYTTPVYWEAGYKYSFNAIAPISANWTYTAPAVVGEQGSIAFTNTDGTLDLVHAYNGTYTDATVARATVDFTFQHLLARVKFQFTETLEDDSQISVSEVKITDAKKNGTVTLGTTTSWDVAEENNTFGLSFGNANLTTDCRYMIPATASYNVSFTVIRNFNGVSETYYHTATLPSLSMSPGNSYVINAEINANNITTGGLQKIEFNVVDVAGWGNDLDGGTLSF